MNKVFRYIVLGWVSVLSVASCGSDSGSDANANTAVEKVVQSDLTWQQGVFKTASEYKNYCKSPRSGADVNGYAYPDKAGSTLHELNWLRSWSHDTYLWYNDIVDQNPATFDDPVKYFETLKTTAVTSTGKPRDRFHFWQKTAEYEQFASSGGRVDYGARFIWVKSSPPRSLKIAYVEANSPASKAGLARGTSIISVDGVRIEDGTDVSTLLSGVYPESDTQSHTFVVQNTGESTSQTVTLTPKVVTVNPVHNTRVIDAHNGKVGYLTFNTFSTATAEQALKTAFDTLSSQSISDLVIDLRYNGGGYLAIASQLGYMVAGTRSESYTFEKTVFNDKHPNVNPVTNQSIVPMPFISTGLGFSVTQGQALPTVSLNRVFILSSARTCSASEALINGLSGIDVDVILIGDTTCGKPYGFYSTDNCGITYSSIQFRGENAKGFGDYADGFSPNNVLSDAGVRVTGCAVQDDFSKPLGDENEAMLKTALDYRNNGGICPSVTATRATQARSAGVDVKLNQRFIERELKQRIQLDAMRLERSNP